MTKDVVAYDIPCNIGKNIYGKLQDFFSLAGCHSF